MSADAARYAVLRAHMLRNTHPKQRAFVEDESPEKSGLCSRRAGKTTGCAIDLALAALAPPERGEMCVYITLTRKNAKQLLWPELRALNARYRLGFEFNSADLMVTAPSGGRIWLGGADNEAQIEKYRGFRLRKAYLDECASFGPHFDALIDEVLRPGLMDCDGQLATIGTPGCVLEGAFYRATTDPSAGYSRHAWTVLDNPYVKNAAAWLANERQRKGMSEDDPRYMREWRGLWVADGSSLVYGKYDPDRNDYAALPAGHVWEYVLGIDFGYTDATAFSVLAFCRDLPDVYVVECDQQVEMIPDDIALRVKSYQNRYAFARIVADTGGLGVGYAAEFRKRHGIPVVAAEKQRKFEFVELLNSDLATGRMKVQRNSVLAGEWRQLQWDDKRKKESSRFANHMSDATLYAWREAKHYAYTPVDVPPAIGTDEHYRREAARLEQEAIRKARMRGRERGW